MLTNTCIFSIVCLTLLIWPVGRCEELCRPDCSPPVEAACHSFHRVARCRRPGYPRESVRIPEPLCGCAWKSFIHKAALVLELTAEDRQTCYQWASQDCKEIQSDIESVVKEEMDISSKGSSAIAKQTSQTGSATEIIYNMLGRLERLEKGEYIIPDTSSDSSSGPAHKHHQSGITETGEVYGKLDTESNRLHEAERVVDAKDNGKFWGKVYKDPVSQWYEIKPGDSPGSSNVENSEKKDSWLTLDNDQFKLMIFGFILLFNALCIMIAMLCKCDQKKEHKENKKAGDLDPDMYFPSRALANNKRTNLEMFLEKLRLHHRKKAKKNAMMPQVELKEFEPSKYSHMQEKPVQIYSTPPKSTKKRYRPLIHDDDDHVYEHLYENVPGSSKRDSTYGQQDITYEQPMVRDKWETVPRYTHDSFSDGDISLSPQYSLTSPMVEATGKRESEGKQVSFSIPSGIDNRERVEPGLDCAKRSPISGFCIVIAFYSPTRVTSLETGEATKLPLIESESPKVQEEKRLDDVAHRSTDSKLEDRETRDL